MQEDRWKETRKNLERIHQAKGTIYTLGLLRVIIARMSINDYNLFKEIEIRAEKAKDDS
jgi:hypothetical protein